MLILCLFLRENPAITKPGRAAMDYHSFMRSPWVMGAFAEFERALIHERQREGIALAKQRGAYKGRKKALSAAAVMQLRARITAGISKAEVAREFGISRQTLYQYLQGGAAAP